MVHHVLHSLSMPGFKTCKGNKNNGCGNRGRISGIPSGYHCSLNASLPGRIVAKKAKVCGEVARSLGLDNVEV